MKNKIVKSTYSSQLVSLTEKLVGDFSVKNLKLNKTE